MIASFPPLPDVILDYGDHSGLDFKEICSGLMEKGASILKIAFLVCHSEKFCFWISSSSLSQVNYVSKPGGTEEDIKQSFLMSLSSLLFFFFCFTCDAFDYNKQDDLHSHHSNLTVNTFHRQRHRKYSYMFKILGSEGDCCFFDL